MKESDDCETKNIKNGDTQYALAALLAYSTRAGTNNEHQAGQSVVHHWAVRQRSVAQGSCAVACSSRVF